MSNIINKVKDALHKDDKSSAPEGTHGHHTNKAANAADPRIDSDRDHRAAGTGVGSTGYTAGDNYTTGGSTGLTGTHGTTGTGMTGTSGLTGTGATGTGAGYGTGPGPAANTAGPHNSDMMNKVDPRVDSDMDGSRNMGANRGGMTGTTGTTTGTTAGMTGTHHPHAGATGTGITGTSGLATTSGSGVGHSNTTGINEPGMGTHGTHHTAGTTGTTGYGSGAATGATGAGGAYGSGPGPAPNTAGPHKSDMLNKADPRVDSNLDGSKTVGGDKTYQA